MSIPRRMPCYQILVDIHLDFSASGLTPNLKPDDYRLELNLDTAVARTTFRHAGTTYTREVFVSASDQVIVMRLAAEGPGSLSFTARLDRPAHFETASAGTDRIVLSGEAIPVNDNPGLPLKERSPENKYKLPDGSSHNLWMGPTMDFGMQGDRPSP
jgi:alpha-L-fucosidase 2